MILEILMNGGSTAGTIIGLFIIYKIYEKKSNSKKLNKTDLELRVTQQEGKCRDRFYSKIEETEKKIIEAIKNNNG